MLNASCVIWNVLVALRDTGGQTEIPAGVNTRPSCPWNTSTWSSTIGQHQILSCFVLGYLANSLIFTVLLDRPVTSVTSPPFLAFPLLPAEEFLLQGTDKWRASRLREKIPHKPYFIYIRIIY